ncbi:hypothetical protein QUH73_11675 [Labilibaculum sp. K2S]|uniref:hypothetical protein n=1 Tax=Labilibaculum sp. K2S TaxID=3056386 RepID=UPI0025A33849|nr:hypothetical protein [Labilibaculum sp. K2S]MDM8160475.1 hypothetical protein [Labilibaculum sp. K2S]
MEFNDQEVIIECPHCKCEIIVNILEITNHKTVSCPKCLGKVDLAANDPSAKLGVPKTYMPFEGLGDYLKQIEEKKKKK